jgi:hypothetical protein
MNGAIPPLPQYSFMAWSSIKAQGKFYLHLLFEELSYRSGAFIGLRWGIS